MERESRAYLWDAKAAADAIAEFTGGKSIDDYKADEMLRAAVERKFEIARLWASSRDTIRNW